MNLSPLDKLTVKTAAWGLIWVLSFFFHTVAFLAVTLIAALATLQFMFVYQNTKDVKTPEVPSVNNKEKNDNKSNQPGSDEWDDTTLPGLGAEWERSVRKNVPEN